jgi:hypothetical protein
MPGRIPTKVVLLLLKTLTNSGISKYCFKSLIRILVSAFLLCLWSISVFASLLLADFCTYRSRLSEPFSRSQMAFHMSSQGHIRHCALYRVTEEGH